MLCQVCSRLEFDAASSSDAFHHESYTNLLSVAKAGCPLCSTFQDQYSKYNSLRFDKYEPDDSKIICGFNHYGQFLPSDPYEQSIGGSNID